MLPLVHSDEVDVIVCTAGKVRRELKVKAVKITDFPLIVADECHHAGRPSNYSDIMEFYIRTEPVSAEPSLSLPQVVGLTASPGAGRGKSNISTVIEHQLIGYPSNYSDIMEFYIRSKLTEPSVLLPQVVGMTASPGAGRGKSNISTVTEQQLSPCATMDATAGIVTVGKNTAELERVRNASKSYLEVKDEHDPSDPFILHICSVMKTLERYIGNIPCLAQGSSKSLQQHV